ncbi:hypothetical protein BH11PSE7_BH11PSE7_31700 [soil metagenome]
MNNTAYATTSAHAGAGRASLLSHGVQRHVHHPDDADKPSLTMPEYMTELNARLRSHPMFLEGMRFPDPQPGSTPMLAAALAWEGPWDCLGVFSSVIEDVASDYELVVNGSR